jgi:hypothetical protein
MDLALAQDLATMEPAKLAAAVAMLRAELLKAIERHGIARIDPAPAAMPSTPTATRRSCSRPPTGVAPGAWCSCFQSGYRLGDHILRSAKVVASAPRSEPCRPTSTCKACGHEFEAFQSIKADPDRARARGAASERSNARSGSAVP